MQVKPASRWKVKPEECFPLIAYERELRGLSRELMRSGNKVLNLNSGDPAVWDFINQPLSKYLVEAAKQGWHSYNGRVNDPHARAQGARDTRIVSSPLYTQLQNAIAAFEKRERGIDLKSENIFIGGGCAGAMLLVHMALLEEGDEVISYEPSHYLQRPASNFPYFKTKVIPCRFIEEEGWQPDLDELRKKIGDRTKLIGINNPNNPTGAVYTEKNLKEIVDIAGEYDVPIISDEVYTFITFDGVVAKSIVDVAGDVPVIVVNGLTKIQMRTGWKVGYAAFHDPEGKMKELISATGTVWRLYGGVRRAMATPILYAATKAFQSSLEAGREFVRGVKKHRDYSMKRINEIDGLSCVEPKGALFTFPQIEAVGEGKPWRSEMEFLLNLAKEEHIIFGAGSLYGEHGFGHFRSSCLPKIEILEDAFNRVEKFMTEHAP